MNLALTEVLRQQILDVGAFASIALALLVVFTNQRFTSWQALEADATPTRRQAWFMVGADAALCLLTVLVLAVLVPLVVDAADELALVHSSGTLPSLFCIVWLGLALLAALQVWIAWSRAHELDWAQIERDRIGSKGD